MVQLHLWKATAVNTSSENNGQVVFDGPELVQAHGLCWEMKSSV